MAEAPARRPGLAELARLQAHFERSCGGLGCARWRRAEVAEGRAARSGAESAARAQQRAARRPPPSTPGGRRDGGGRLAKRGATRWRRCSRAVGTRRRRSWRRWRALRGAARAADARVARRRAVGGSALTRQHRFLRAAASPAAPRAAVSTPQAGDGARAQLRRGGEGIERGTDEDVFIELIGSPTLAAARALRPEYAICAAGTRSASAVRDEGRLLRARLAFQDLPDLCQLPLTPSRRRRAREELHTAVEGLRGRRRVCARAGRVLGARAGEDPRAVREPPRYGKPLAERLPPPSLCSRTDLRKLGAARCPPRFAPPPRHRPSARPPPPAAAAPQPRPRRLRALLVVETPATRGARTASPPRANAGPRRRRDGARAWTPAAEASASCASPRRCRSLRTPARARAAATRSTRRLRLSGRRRPRRRRVQRRACRPTSTVMRATRSASPAAFCFVQLAAPLSCNSIRSAAKICRRRRRDGQRGVGRGRRRIVRQPRSHRRAAEGIAARAARRDAPRFPPPANGRLWSASNTRKRMREDAERNAGGSRSAAAEASGASGGHERSAATLHVRRAERRGSSTRRGRIGGGVDEDVFIAKNRLRRRRPSACAAKEYAMRFGHTLASAVRDEMGAERPRGLLVPRRRRLCALIFEASAPAERARRARTSPVEGLGYCRRRPRAACWAVRRRRWRRFCDGVEESGGKPVPRLRTEFVPTADLRKLVVTRGKVRARRRARAVEAGGWRDFARRRRCGRLPPRRRAPLGAARTTARCSSSALRIGR